MRKSWLIVCAIVFIGIGCMITLFIQYLYAPGNDAVPHKNGTTIAISDGAEILDIHCNRVHIANGVPEADVTNMEIHLLFPMHDKNSPIDSGTVYLIDLIELGPVVDNTGKILSSPDRREKIKNRYFEGEIKANHMTGSNTSGYGPVIPLTFDIPARSATALKRITGRANVTRVKKEKLTFDNLSAIKGKFIEDARLGGLSVQPFIEMKDGSTILTLRVPLQHVRLLDWDLVVNERPARLTTQEASDRFPGKIDLHKRYLGDHSSSSLILTLAVPVETKTFNFNFENVALP